MLNNTTVTTRSKKLGFHALFAIAIAIALLILGAVNPHAIAAAFEAESNIAKTQSIASAQNMPISRSEFSPIAQISAAEYQALVSKAQIDQHVAETF